MLRIPSPQAFILMPYKNKEKLIEFGKRTFENNRTRFNG